MPSERLFDRWPQPLGRRSTVEPGNGIVTVSRPGDGPLVITPKNARLLASRATDEADRAVLRECADEAERQHNALVASLQGRPLGELEAVA